MTKQENMERLEHNALQVVNRLLQGDMNEKISAARTLKNEVIGNKTKKEIYVKLNALPVLIEAIRNYEQSAEFGLQAIAALGSIACNNPQGSRAVIDAKALDPLFRTVSIEHDSDHAMTVDMNKEDKNMINTPLIMLKSEMTEKQQDQIVEAAARTIKILFEYAADISVDDLFLESSEIFIIDLLIHFLTLGTKRPLVADMACIVVAHGCNIKKQFQNLVAERGGISSALNLFVDCCNSSSFSTCRFSSLRALASLSWLNVNTSEQLVKLGIVPYAMKTLHSSNPRLRLEACKLLANLLHLEVLPKEFPHSSREVSTAVIPTLVQLFSEKREIKREAPRILSHAVAHSEHLQKVACDADAIPQLANYLSGGDQEIELYPDLAASAFSALATLCSKREDARKAVMEAKLLPMVVHALRSPDLAVRSSAASCVRSLSRSVKHLRTALIETGIADPLFALLFDESLDVRVSACATICNIVPDFPPMKHAMLQNGGVEMLTKLTQSEHDPLRENAVWALKNILFRAEYSVKEAVMQYLTYPGLLSLMSDANLTVREYAVSIFRNLVYSKEGQTQATELDKIILSMGQRTMLKSLEENLKASHDVVVMNALYTICNIASGAERHKLIILESELPKLILEATYHNSVMVRVAAGWCVTNLSWKDTADSHDDLGGYQTRMGDDDDSVHGPDPSEPIPTSSSAAPAPGSSEGAGSSSAGVRDAERAGEYNAYLVYSWKQRIVKLREMGFEKRLREMTRDENIDVQDQGTRALKHFISADNDGDESRAGGGAADGAVAGSGPSPPEESGGATHSRTRRFHRNVPSLMDRALDDMDRALSEGDEDDSSASVGNDHMRFHP